MKIVAFRYQFCFSRVSEHWFPKFSSIGVEEFRAWPLLIKRVLNRIKHPHNWNRTTMSQQRDLNRTRLRIMASAEKEFAARGFAGARTDAIARRAHVNERMIFYCFESKQGLYKAVLAQKLSEKAALLESMPDADFTANLVKGFATLCDDVDGLRMWLWEALDRSNRKIIAEEERKAVLQVEVAQWRRAQASGFLPPDAEPEMLLLVSAALRVFPLVLPQFVSLITGMDPLDPEFRRKWSECLEGFGRRLFTSTRNSGVPSIQKADPAAKRGKSSLPHAAADGGRN